MAKTEVIGIYDSNFNQVFLDTKFMKASVLDTSQIFSHPLEDGSQTIDHKIANPIEIELSIILAGNDYRNTYKSLKKLDTDATTLTIQTRTDVYPDMLIYSLPYEEDAEVGNGIKLTVSLKQIQRGTTTIKVVPKSAKDSTKQNNGNVQGTSVSGTKRTSILASVL
jgi:hypothetical protein